MESNITFIQRISVKITILVLVILATGVGITIFYFSVSQNKSLLDTRFKALQEESNMLYTAVKNTMLSGDAPVAVELFRDLSRLQGHIRLFRADGVSAFSDNNTLATVNDNLGGQQFPLKSEFTFREINVDQNFKNAVNFHKDIFVNKFQADSKEVITYKPLFNQPRCSSCHGRDHIVRGVLMISTSVKSVYERNQKNTMLSIIIFGLVVLVLTVAIILFLHWFVLRRMIRIGKVVELVGQGDFKTKIDIFQKDEIGVLAQKINNMIDGLSERFKLTKFVSKSTLDHIQKAGDVSLGGEKKVMTVLFSDIRGFTAYSENRDPSEVMSELNKIMNLQAEIVNHFDGDIDKYVGDELMAVFEGEDMVMRAVLCAEKIVRTLHKVYQGAEKPIQVGIGINTGELIAGNMGSGERMDRTVIGDTVNLGARLCSRAGKNVVVISEFSYVHVKERIAATRHNPIKVKGKSKAVAIYTLRKTL